MANMNILNLIESDLFQAKTNNNGSGSTNTEI
jgi:hypothetical protein